MARPLRIEYPGAIYHVTARGNERRAIFRTNADRNRFLEKLGEVSEGHRIDVYAYVLMTNHYHVVLCTPRANLSSFMQRLQTSYTVYFNRRHARTGHLFAGRFKAKLVEGGSYLLRLTRYVHLNPVRIERLREAPPEEKREWLGGYRWSSYPSYVGLASAQSWMTYEGLKAFADAGDSDRQQQAYEQFVCAALEESDEELVEALKRSGRAVGGDAFRRRVESLFRERVAAADRWVDISLRRQELPVGVGEVTSAVLAAYGIEADELFRRGNREARDVWMLLACEEAGLTRREIGQRLGHGDGGTVSRRLAWLAEAMALNEDLTQKYNVAKSGITNSKA